MTALIAPHGGTLIDLVASGAALDAAKKRLLTAASWDLTARQVCDVELLLNGGFSPLRGFLNQADYDSVVETLRLKDGTLWPMPITLDVSETFAASVSVGQDIALRDSEGVALAILTVESKYTPDKKKEAVQVFGADDTAHPAVQYLHTKAGAVYLGGTLTGLELPTHYDFKHLRTHPKQLRELFTQRGWGRIVAFQTRNPMHRAHYELTKRAAISAEANLLVHPVVGMTKPGDVDHYSRVRCYEHVLASYPESTAMLSLLPLAMRMAGPREALWHAIIRKNYGCNFFIVGRDHAGPGKNSQGKDFYGAYDAQELVKKYQDELGITMVPFQEMLYAENRCEYVPADEVTPDDKVLNISGTEFRRRLQNDIDVPEWFSFPAVLTELKRTYPPKARQGFCLFFTGLSGSGKSTIANAVMVKLLEIGGRAVTMLDGDQVRKHLSSELGFSKEHRDLNIRRIGYVASEIAKSGGIAICAPIAPYAATRRDIRESFEGQAGFLEIHVSTPIETCEARDRKGLYAKARAGILKGFTGIDDPYEAPENPDICLDTSQVSKEEAAQRIVLKLQSLGYIG
ncbi:MAG: bifunctional sulfate adenylyltransferase/adenylylsulfate kinase [Alphaproteobacteria bacterium]|nr:bifunctional sulfate adenylyltransferase/adenylylsulfate kinase [Alphaproteobacteria bacterium]